MCHESAAKCLENPVLFWNVFTEIAVFNLESDKNFFDGKSSFSRLFK